MRTPRPKKSLGQHFLRCAWVAGLIADAADLGAADTVLEVGPGDGALTRALARRAGRVIAVEKDEKLAASLVDDLKKEGAENVVVLTGDILEEMPQIIATYNLQSTTYKLASNIPYYITGRLLRLIFEQRPLPRAVVLTVQKEVARRIAAHPPRMSMPSLLAQAYGAPDIVADVPASCFYPRPKVESAILRISGISDDFFLRHAIRPEKFFALARAAFMHKRKTLLNSLASVLPKKSKQETEKMLDACGVKKTARPEELTREQWAALARRA